jgi:hypothetical protein
MAPPVHNKTMANPFHKVKRIHSDLPSKIKPILIKVEPKTKKMGRPISEQRFDADLLNKEEDVDIGDELVPEYHSPNDKRSSEPFAISDTLDTKAYLSKSDLSGSEIACKHNNSGEKYEGESNISNHKNSMSISSFGKLAKV